MMEVSFRLLADADVPQIVCWLRDPEVGQWWVLRGQSDDELIEEWRGKAAGSDDKTDRYIIVVDGTDIGAVQTYRTADYPEHDAEIGLADAAGVDIFIGKEEYRHRGLGAGILTAFVGDVVFGQSDSQVCTIDPAPTNTIAIRSYEKAGFRYVRSYYSDAEGVDVYLMRLDRDDFSG